MSDLYNRIECLCHRNNINPTQLAVNVGISRAILSDLKHGRSQNLSNKTLKKIADYFGVTVDFFLSDTPVTVESLLTAGSVLDNVKDMDIKKEKIVLAKSAKDDLLSIVNGLSEDEVKAVSTYIKVLLSERE